MDFDTIKGLAKHHKQAFGRIVKCEMYKMEDGNVLALTRMHDDFHDMNLAILLDEAYHIREIAGRMDRIPYPCCETKPLEMLAALKGVGVMERGGLRKVKELIPRNMGCTHVYEMLESTFRSIFVGSYRITDAKWEGILDLDMDEHQQLGVKSSLLGDSCYAFNAASVDEETFSRAVAKIEEAGKKMRAIEAVKRGA